MRLWKQIGVRLAACGALLATLSPARADLYVSSTGGNQVLEYTDAGAFVRVYASVTSPQGVAIDNAVARGTAKLYVASGNRIIRYDLTVVGGSPTTYVTLSASQTVHDIVVDPANGTLYASTQGGSNADRTVQRIPFSSGTGTATMLFGTLDNPEGLALSPLGDFLYVAEPGNQKTSRISNPGGATPTKADWVTNVGDPFDFEIGPDLAPTTSSNYDVYLSTRAAGDNAVANTVMRYNLLNPDTTETVYVSSSGTPINILTGIAFRSDNVLIIGVTTGQNADTIRRTTGSGPPFATTQHSTGTQPVDPTYLTFGPAAVPEPGTMVLLGMTGAALTAYAWRTRASKRRKAAA